MWHTITQWLRQRQTAQNAINLDFTRCARSVASLKEANKELWQHKRPPQTTAETTARTSSPHFPPIVLFFFLLLLFLQSVFRKKCASQSLRIERLRSNVCAFSEITTLVFLLFSDGESRQMNQQSGGKAVS